MKRILIFALICFVALSSAALAFDPSRFENVEGVVMDYNPEDPEVYRVLAGFEGSSSWTQMGGHTLIRYSNAGKSEDLPLMLMAFTASDLRARRMIIRTDAHLYKVTCTDLAAAGLNAIDTEGQLLVCPESTEMLYDVAQSPYVKISIYDTDPDEAFTFMPGSEDQAMIELFLQEYTQEVAPRLWEGSTLSMIYKRLAPMILAEETASISEATQAVRDETYTELSRGSSGESVARLQRALIDLKLLNDKADGTFGGRTEEAVKRFQRDNGLKATGVADADTQILLYLTLLENQE